MSLSAKIIAIASLVFLAVIKANGQPVWVRGTPSVASTGPLSITLNYGIDKIGTVYVIVFDFNNMSQLSSSYVRTSAAQAPAGTIVATAVLPVKKGDTGKILQTILGVNSPGQVHTIYLVAADNRGVLQSLPERLNATTLTCPQANAGTGGNECDRNFGLNAVLVFGTGTWTKVTGPGNESFSPNANTPDAVVSVTEYGEYIFRWTEEKGVCKSSADINVNFYQSPVANAGTGGDECDLDFDLKAVPSFGTGIWRMTSGTGTATFIPDARNNEARVIVSDYGSKIFTWKETNGQCSDSAVIAVNFYELPVANAGTGGNNCGLKSYMNAVPTTGTGTWTRVSGPGNATFRPDTHMPNAEVTVSAYGTYVFRWTEVNGPCQSSSTVTINFYEYLSANGGNGGDECDTNFQLNAVPGTGTGTWSKIGGPGNAIFSPDVRQYNALVTVSLPGSYDFAWTEVNFNCSSVDIIRVVFHNPPSVNAGDDSAVCNGSSIRLQATGTGNFQWDPAHLLNNPTVPDPVATPVVTTAFTVRLTDQWGCINTDMVTIEVIERPVPDAGPDQVLEYIFETVLEAGVLKPDETGEWTVLSGTGVFDDYNTNNTRVKGLSLGTNSLRWIVDNGICPESSDTVNIIVKELLLPNLITPNMDGRNDLFIIKGIESMGKCGLNVFNRWGEMVYATDNYLNDWDGRGNYGDLLPEDTYFYILIPELNNPIKGYIVIRK